MSDTSTRRPIAVIGMACRLPGADSIDQLWDLLWHGKDATSDTPADRYDADALYSAAPQPGKVASRRSGYLTDPGRFDAGFFGLSRHEASALDPQQRLLMMTAWEAFEDAGLPPARLAGTRTGVYVGSMHTGYADLTARRGLTALRPSGAYNYRCMLSGRLSYLFDLRGPSLTVDTACSSSLVAVHLAAQGLRVGETELAVAAGVNLKLTADEDVMLSQARMLAPDGRCKFGDASANGFAPSDGVGVVVLKPLDAALADRDRIRAVVLGSAVGNDGASGASLLAPSVEGHVQMLRWAYRDAGVAPGEVDFIEAHGTGTPMIDPVEFTGLGQVLAEGRPADRPCYVGSVKSNVGHTEGAAGVAALIKTVLCLQHREIVPSLHYTTPNPAIDWSALPLRVPTRRHSLPDLGRPAIAGVSGQGISSVNAHLVLGEAARAWNTPETPAQPDRPHLLPLSARTPGALGDLVRAYLAYLGPGAAGSRTPLRDICHSAALHRQHHPHRIAVLGSRHDTMIAGLSGFLTGRAPALKHPWTDASEPGSALTELAATYLAGEDPDWTRVREAGARFVDIPTYPWQTERYWLGA